MCGISGLINKRGRFSREEMAILGVAMADTMVHRGPDDSGVWVSDDDYCVLSHRRLSIIDTSAAGRQPFLSPSGREAITYNGEFYSFLELKDELSQSGVSFHTRTDTEVLLAGLLREGPALLSRIDAMFAFGFYDSGTRELLLARDIFGEKPLYYYDCDAYFAFASELHALTLLPDFDPSIDREAIATFLSLQYLPAPRTIYSRARKLPPGSFLRLRPGEEARVERYFAFHTAGIRRNQRSLDELAEELEEILLRSLRRRLIADVPLGAFLSGGVDSSTLAALVTRRLNRSLQTFSIGFAGHEDSEHLDAREMARHLGTDHHEQIVSPDMLELGSRIGAVLDEPNGDSSCLPTYLLSQFARQSVTVALSGDGGDELFGGYGRYFVTVDEDDRRRRGGSALAGWKPGEVYLSGRILVYPDAVLGRLLGGMPAGLGADLATAREGIDRDQRPLINVLRELDAANYLPGAVLAKVDRMSMQHSLEVRAPLLGIEVANFAMGLAADDCYAKGQGKLVLKRVARRYIPEAWLNRPKRGFGMPMDRWGAKELLPITRQRLLASDGKVRGWIDPARLERFLFRQRLDFNAYRVWSLFILENWLASHPVAIVGGRGGGGARRTGGLVTAVARWFGRANVPSANTTGANSAEALPARVR